MDSVTFLKPNHLDLETHGCQKERGPETVVNTSKEAAGLQPLTIQPGHFAYKHLEF